MILRIFTAFILLLAQLPLPAEESNSPLKNTDKQTTGEKASPLDAKPLVKKLSADIYQIGKVTFNKKSREISLDAQTNIVDPESLLEFVLVHLNGEKVHESLLVTEADPTHLNIALKLLNYKESQELFRPLTEDGERGEEYQKEDDDVRSAARFNIFISWKDGEQQKKIPLTQWLKHRITKKSMPNNPWVYNGSYVHAKKFKAKLNGNFFAILPNESAIATFFGADGIDRYDDTLWLPAPSLPNAGTKVTITLIPWSGNLAPQILK